MTFTHLDLFAGIGGFSRAVRWLGGNTVAMVEWDAWCRRVLAKHWPHATFFGDIHGVTTDELLRLGPIDLITGGYPCQPFSVAGKRLGHHDPRHLWPEMRRVINAVRPRYVLAENVDGHVTKGLDRVLDEMEADGYAWGAVVVPAAGVGALHKRSRVWIMAANTDAGLRHGADEAVRTGRDAADGACERMAHAGQGHGGRWPGAAGGHERDGHDAGRQEATGGIDERGQGVADPEGERGWADARGVGEGAASALRDAKREGHVVGWPGWREREPCGDGVTDRGRAERQIVGPVDAGADGIPTGLVRRPAARSAWDDPDVIRQMWASGAWEADLPRVVAEEADRRQKLQGAGNAIVPLVAYEILKIMMMGGDDE